MIWTFARRPLGAWRSCYLVATEDKIDSATGAAIPMQRLCSTSDCNEFVDAGDGQRTVSYGEADALR
jgi:hypothetical protein